MRASGIVPNRCSSTARGRLRRLLSQRSETIRTACWRSRTSQLIGSYSGSLLAPLLDSFPLVDRPPPLGHWLRAREWCASDPPNTLCWVDQNLSHFDLGRFRSRRCTFDPQEVHASAPIAGREHGYIWRDDKRRDVGVSNKLNGSFPAMIARFPDSD